MALAPSRWCVRCRMAHNARCELSARQGRQEADRQRGGSSERGYDAAWQRFRVWFLSHYPLCSDCSEIATEVHHKHRLRDGGAKLDEANCMALCHVCHSRRTARGE